MSASPIAGVGSGGTVTISPYGRIIATPGDINASPLHGASASPSNTATKRVGINLNGSPLRSTTGGASALAADPSVRRSNLIVRGVVSSVKRELRGGGSGGPSSSSGGAAQQYGGGYSFGGPYGDDSANPHVAAGTEHVATFVLDASEGAASSVVSGGGPSSPSRMAGGRANVVGVGAAPSAAAAAASSGGIVTARPPSNTVTVQLEGDWALSTSFVAVGDILEMARFDVDTSSSSRVGGGGVGVSGPSGLVLIPNNSTELHVTRMRHAAINQTNVGQLELLDLTDREVADARHAFSDVPPHRFGDRNAFSQVDAYYDIIKGQSEAINPQMTFLQSLFGFRTRLLDAGCGSGLHSFAFRGYGVYPVCIDSSHTMQRRFEEKNRFFQLAEAQQRGGGGGGGSSGGANPNFTQQQQFIEEGYSNYNSNNGTATAATHNTSGNNGFMGDAMGPNTTRSTLMARKAQKALALRGTSELEFHLADISSFSLAKRDTDGNVRYTEFEGVLCLDVLALLPDEASMRAAVHNLALHTGRGGLAVISIPNATVALTKGCHMNTTAFEIDRFRLSVGASVSAPHGTLHLTETVLIEVPNPPPSSMPLASNVATGGGGSRSAATASSSSLPRRVTTWRGTAFHPSAAGAGDKFVTFVETFTELLLPAGLAEEMFREGGYAIKALYSSLCGDAFSDAASDNRVYVLQRV